MKKLIIASGIIASILTTSALADSQKRIVENLTLSADQSLDIKFPVGSVDIEIVDPELRDIEIGGQIQVGDTDSMFKALEANFGLKVKRLSYNRVQVVALAQLNE